MSTDELIAGLPGEALVRQGLADYRDRLCTIHACLIAIARPRMVQAGLVQSASVRWLVEPEFQLYRLLGEQSGDTYSRYNALVRELISFELALDRRLSRNHAVEMQRLLGLFA